MKLSDICDVYSGYALKEFNNEGDGFPVIKIGNILSDGSLLLEDCQYSKENINEKYFSKYGDIYVALSGATTGKIGIMQSREKHIINQRVGIVRKKDSDIPESYIKYFLLHQTERILNDASGCAQPNISPKQIALYEVPNYGNEAILSIVSSLDKISNIIELRKQQLQQLVDLVKARFVDMFGEVETNIKGFNIKRMDECCKFIGGAQPNKSYFEYEKTDDNIRLIQIRDYKSDRFVTYIPKTLARKTCTASDIMIGRYGPPIFQILGGIEGAYNVALMKAVPTDEFNVEYFRYFLKDEKLLHYLESFSQRTAGQDGIQIDKLNEYPCLVPPMDLQNDFAAFVEQVDKSKVAVQKALDEAQTLFDSLMQKYFG